MRVFSIRPTMTIKLLASIGVLLAITFVVGGVAIANLGKVERVGEELYSQRLLPLNTADDVQAGLIYQRALVFEEMFDARSAQFEGAPRADMLSELSESDDEIAGVAKQLDAGLAKLGHGDLPAHSRESLAQLRSSYAKFARDRKHVLALAHSSQIDDADEAWDAAQDSSYAASLKAVDGLVASMRDDAKPANAHIASVHSSARRLELILLALAALFAAGIGYVITTRLKPAVPAILDGLRSLSEHDSTDLAHGLEALATGDLTQEVTARTPAVTVNSRDEFGAVARAVEKVRERLAAAVQGPHTPPRSPRPPAAPGS